MGPRPWRPAAELDAALDRGDLRYASALAEELRLERGAPVPLDVALKFLPLVASERPDDYDAFARRWFGRWASETGTATIAQAAEVAASLADLPIEPASSLTLLSDAC